MTSLIVGLLTSFAVGQASTVELEYSGPYCGLYSAYAAARALGVDPDFSNIVSRDYISSGNGSTIQDLERAIQTMGLFSHPFASFSCENLSELACPVILHVAVPGTGSYKHWVLFLGFTESGLISIYDPPRSYATITPAELLSIWDGSGIAVTREASSPFGLAIPISPLCSTLLIFFLLRTLSRSKTTSSYTCILVVVIACVGSVVWHLASPNGFGRNSSAIGNVTSAHFRSNLIDLDLNQFQLLVMMPDTVLVDARLPGDYRAGHMPGAINIPITIGYSALRDRLLLIPKDRRIICYCFSHKCRWADSIGNYFANRGYREVLVYRGGYLEWNAHQKED